MGNTDSHSSLDPAAEPARSLRFCSSRVPSARSWWRSSRGRNQHPTGYYEHKAARIGSRLSSGSPQAYRNPFGFLESSGGATLQSGGSPKVLLSKDGSMRVEFTNSRVPVEPQGLTGLPAISAAPGSEPSLRTSKGSSVSSDGSWYDSPWGPGAEPEDVFACRSVDNSSGYATFSSTRTQETATSRTFFSAPLEDFSPGFTSDLLLPPAEAPDFTSASSGRTEDSGIGDSVILQPRDFSLVSSSLDDVYDLDVPRGDPVQEERQCYSSLTLPCRRAGPLGTASGNNRKDFLKSRIRRLSDWTGSLSRKKRRIQVRELVFIPPGDDFSLLTVKNLKQFFLHGPLDLLRYQHCLTYSTFR